MEDEQTNEKWVPDLETWVPVLETWRRVREGEVDEAALVLQHQKHVGGVLYDIMLSLDGWYYRRPSPGATAT